MKNIIENDLRKLDHKYNDEVFVAKYCKVYSVVFFSSNYVFKIFSSKDNVYDESAVWDEYNWDRCMPFLNPELYNVKSPTGDFLNILVMDRLPEYANVLFKLINQRIKIFDIIKIGHKILNLEAMYPSKFLTSEKLYDNFISNVQLQMSFLKENLPNNIKKRINNVLNSTTCKNTFLFQNQATLVHGNMFTGNIFMYDDCVIFIDPISVNHLSKISYPDIDIASFFVDLKILLAKDKYDLCFFQITSNLPENRIQLIKYYMLLKLLVRIRFSHLELHMMNLTYENSMNYKISRDGIDILRHYLQELSDGETIKV